MTGKTVSIRLIAVLSMCLFVLIGFTSVLGAEEEPSGLQRLEKRVDRLERKIDRLAGTGLVMILFGAF